MLGLDGGASMTTYIHEERDAITGFFLTLLGGFFIIINGVALSVVGSGYTYLNPEYYLGYYFGSLSAYYMMAMGIACGFFGLLVITGGILVRMEHMAGGGLMAIVFSTLSVFFGGGFMVGTIFGILGGLLAILER